MTLTLNVDEITDEQPLVPMARSFYQIFYPPIRSTNLSCFQILDLSEKLQLAFSLQYITILSKFGGNGDAYLFLSEFEEACSTTQFPNVS